MFVRFLIKAFKIPTIIIYESAIKQQNPKPSF